MREILEGPYHFFDSTSYVELRDCACSCLTLLNARRGGEPARLLLDDYIQATNSSWIDEQRLSELDEIDMLLVKTLKITYMTGKGNNHLVPVLIPPDTVPALKLADPEIRKEANVYCNNIYLFPSTKQSDGHASGWHTVHNVIEKLALKKPRNFKATANRHRISTLFSAIDLPKKDRELFYKHMGHSAGINEGTYQAPPAILEITKVGKHLLDIDSSYCSVKSSKVPCSGKSTSVASSLSVTCLKAPASGKQNSLGSRYTLRSGVAPRYCDALLAESEESDSDYKEPVVSTDTEEYESSDDNLFQVKTQELKDKDNSGLSSSRSRPYHSWTTAEEEILRGQFSHLIEKNKMPDHKTLKDFIQKSGLNLGYETVRTKLTNERVKARNARLVRLKGINVDCV